MSEQSLSKAELVNILSLSRSDRERELIKCTAFLASGMSNRSARDRFGFQNLPERLTRLKKSIEVVNKIKQRIESLFKVQENAFKQTLGIVDISDDTDGSSDISTEDDMQSTDSIYDVNSSPCLVELSESMFFELLRKSEFNWFELVDSVNCRQSLVDREANALKGQIVSDNESESLDDYLDLDVIENAERLIAKKKRQLK